MRRMWFSLVVVALVASTSLAQRQRQPRQGGGRGGPRSALQLLSNKSVAEELKLTDDQKKKVEEASKANRDEREKLMKDAGLTNRDFFNPDKREEFAKINKTLSASADKAIDPVLTTDQKKRFGQIRLQLQGSRAFSDEKVQKNLKMTDDQVKKIKEISDALTKERTELFKDINPREDREKFQEALKKAEEKQKEAEGKIAASLSAEQKKAFSEMKGDKFEFKPDMRRPGGGGGTPRRPRTDLN